MDAERVDADHQADPLGLGEQQDPPRLTRLRAGGPGVQYHPGPLLERHRDAQVAATWTCSPGGPATRSWRAASERTASASTSSDGRASRKSTIASTAVSSAMV